MVEGTFFTFGSAYEMWAFRIAVVALVSFLIGGMVLVTRPQEEVIGHPKGLFLLFMAEMWERFSYYGMRALLIFYLVQHWLFTDSEASVIYGAYTALVYITPVVGGYLADRYVGQRKAVLFGAVLLTFSDGRPREEFEVVNQLKSGPFREWHDTGEWTIEESIDPETGDPIRKRILTGEAIRREGEYVNGKLDGDVYNYDLNGRLLLIEHFEDGTIKSSEKQ